MALQDLAVCHWDRQNSITIVNKMLDIQKCFTFSNFLLFIANFILVSGLINCQKNFQQNCLAPEEIQNYIN